MHLQCDRLVTRTFHHPGGRSRHRDYAAIQHKIFIRVQPSSIAGLLFQKSCDSIHHVEEMPVRLRAKAAAAEASHDLLAFTQ